ncbi:Fibronectin type 3 and ankyrin repeat domains protein 1 [Irineochytrium annulatum]|nr:Fibronectin type 3 and ankyrin repeat domains protein 1 [Irineochytrium annulatum]
MAATAAEVDRFPSAAVDDNSSTSILVTGDATFSFDLHAASAEREQPQGQQCSSDADGGISMLDDMSFIEGLPVLPDLDAEVEEIYVQEDGVIGGLAGVDDLRLHASASIGADGNLGSLIAGMDVPTKALDEVEELVPVARALPSSSPGNDQTIPLSITDLRRSRLDISSSFDRQQKKPKARLQPKSSVTGSLRPPLPHQLNKSAVSNATTDPSELSHMISMLAEMDLQTEDMAFQTWLSKKQAANPARTSRNASVRSSPIPAFTPSPRFNSPGAGSPTMTGRPSAVARPIISTTGPKEVIAKQLSSLTREEVEDLRRRRRENEKSFRAWLEKKEITALDQLEANERRQEVERRRRLTEEQKKEEQRSRVELALVEWAEQKKIREKEEKERKALEERERERMRADKREKGIAAYRAWVDRKKKGGDDVGEFHRVYRHKSRWMDTVPGFGMIEMKPKRGRRKELTQEILSPPGLYKDFPRCETSAPNYLRKYPYQVASGGHGLVIDGDVAFRRHRVHRVISRQILMGVTPTGDGAKSVYYLSVDSVSCHHCELKWSLAPAGATRPASAGFHSPAPPSQQPPPAASSSRRSSVASQKNGSGNGNSTGSPVRATSAKSTTARSPAVKNWTQKEMFLLQKAEGTDPVFEKCYEGTSMAVMVENLKPKTKYRFRVRAFDDNINDFSKEFAETSLTTTDETQLQRLTTQLFRAVTDDDAAQVEQILRDNSKEINVESRDKNGRTPLMVACKTGSPEMIQILLYHGAQVTSTTASGKTPLSIAVTYDNLPAVRQILEKEPKAVDLADQGGSTPLMWSAENGNNKHGVEIMQTLIKAGAEVLKEDMSGGTALERLCMTSGSVKCARLLLENGAVHVVEVDKKRGMTTLMAAALNGHTSLVRELIDKWHANIHATTEHNQTARAFAETAGHQQIVDVIDKKVKMMKAATEEATKARQDAHKK